jgi:hypothetical protein
VQPWSAPAIGNAAAAAPPLRKPQDMQGGERRAWQEAEAAGRAAGLEAARAEVSARQQKLDDAAANAARSGDPLLAGEALQLRGALLVQRDRTDACAPLLARAEAAQHPGYPEQAGMIAQGL